MNRWLKPSATPFELRQLIRLDRAPEIGDEIVGYVANWSAMFLLLHAFDGDYINLNGYITLRVADIHRFRIVEDHDFFINRALKLKSIEPVLLPEVDLSNFSTLFTSASRHFPLITIHREMVEAETCFIGQPQKITEKTVTLKEINPAAEWKRTCRYNLKDITRVDFGGGYEEALWLVSEHEASTR